MATELAMELEDDLFFADISKQISLLIMDEDDEDPVAVCSAVSFQGLLRGNYQAAAATSPFMNEQSCRTRESKGTGVFIPRSSQPRRKHHQHHRQGRICSFNPKSQSHQHRQHQQQQHGNTRTLSCNSNSSSSSSTNASNPRRAYRDAPSVST